MISAYAADKDNLESALYESQQTVRELEVRRATLEGENQELLVKKENLQGWSSPVEFMSFIKIVSVNTQSWL